MSRQGVYSTTVTRPDLYRPYLMEQLTLLQQDYDVTFEVGPSEQEIPFPYVLDGSDVVLNPSQTAAIARYFPTTDLAHIGDEISDGLFDPAEDFPLSQFDGLRTDFSLARLRHYTGTPVEHVQSYILFTNYNRYVDEFVRWACEQLKDPEQHLRDPVVRRRGGDHARDGGRRCGDGCGLEEAPDARLSPDRARP